MGRESDDILKILEFSEYPGPRYIEQGKSSGEEFYHSILNGRFANAIKNGHCLIVDLDNTAGYASSFLDEAFGNLVFDFTHTIVKKHLKIESKQEKDWEDMILNKVMPDWEKRRIDNTLPKKTVAHDPWYKYSNGEIKLDS